MTLQVYSDLKYNLLANVNTLNITFDNILIDAAGEKAGFILRAPKAGEISKIGFKTNVVTTGDTVDVRLENVSTTTGLPDGTLVDGVAANVGVVISTTDNTWYTATLTATATVTKGQYIAVVIVNGAVPGVINIAKHDVTIRTEGRFPFSAQFTASWVDVAGAPNVVIGYDDGTFPDLNWDGPRCADGGGEIAFNSTDSPDEIGNIFQIPFPARVAGFEFSADLGVTQAMEVILYDSDGTSELLNFSPEEDTQRDETNPGKYIYKFASTADLVKDTNYRLVLKPGTTDTEVQFYSVDDAAHLESWPGGTAMHRTERTNAGAWSQTTTQRIQIYPIFSAFGDDAGGGTTFIPRRQLLPI